MNNKKINDMLNKARFICTYTIPHVDFIGSDSREIFQEKYKQRVAMRVLDDLIEKKGIINKHVDIHTLSDVIEISLYCFSKSELEKFIEDIKNS